MLTSPDFKELLSLLEKYKADLIKAKVASGRPQDLLDLAKLEKTEARS